MREFSFGNYDLDSFDDLHSALESNRPTEFKVDDVTHILAEVCGANDGDDWWWILKLKGNKFFLLSGGCDYTGWDCQSSTQEHGYFPTANDCAKASPEEELYSRRKIRQTLLDQISGKLPFGVYFQKNKD